MNLTDLSTRQWPSVAAAVALVALFGLTSIAALPIQLLPTIEEPQISVANFWRAAAPEEMEANIVEPQENVLRNTPGVTNINSFIGRGTGFVNLSFAVGTDIETAKLDVINNLTQAPPRPGDALEPQVSAGGGQQGLPAASLLIRVLPDNPVHELSGYQKLIEDHVEPRLARIPGVSQVNLQSEQPRELHITFDSYRAAALGVQINDIVATVSRATDTSGGFADVGRRQYTVRFVGQFEPAQLNELIVGWSNERPIYLNEVADVDIVPRKQDGFTIRNGYPAYYITVQREPDANTVAILDEVNKAIVELNDNVLHDAGLEMDLSFDASVHIRRAIELVKNNLGLGLLLAVGVLYFLMRSRRATFLVTATVPLSVLVAFVALRLFDKSLNVISLAGLAFAVGLVMDAAIVTLENIVRCRQSGMSQQEAVTSGTKQITGALFASTVTSVAIFLPVLFMEGMEGQLFQDLALTIAVAVSASFFIAITVLPVAAKFLLRQEKDDPLQHWWSNVSDFVMRLTRTPAMCASWIAGILGASLLVIFLLVPKANLLPQAPSDFMRAFFVMPPGGTVEMAEKEIAGTVVERLRPYMDHEQQPYIRGYILFAFGSFSQLVVYPLDPARIEEMMQIVRDEVLIDLPDTQAFVQRGSLLNFGFDGGRSINVDLQGPDFQALSDIAMRAMPMINEAIPGAQVRPQPSLQIAEPELQLVPNDRRITAAGLDRATVANIVRALTSGSFVGEYFDGNDRMDMILKGPSWRSPEELAAIPIATPAAARDDGPGSTGDTSRNCRTAAAQLDAGRHEPRLPRHGRSTRGRARCHDHEPGRCRSRPVPGTCRHVPLPVGRYPRDAIDAAGDRGWRSGAARPQPVYGAGHGPADNDWLPDPARSRRQQRDPAHHADTHRAVERARPQRRGCAGRAPQSAPDLHEYLDQHLRHAAADARARRRFANLPRTGNGHHRRHVHFRLVHPDPDAECAAFAVARQFAAPTRSDHRRSHRRCVRQ
jgi:multidrug efflux pump subunit AcrB